MKAQLAESALRAIAEKFGAPRPLERVQPNSVRPSRMLQAQRRKVERKKK